jgi:flagella basal body P-ring formation protein FlgA
VPAVRAGDSVVVEAGSGALQIRAQGRAMQSAGLGEPLRVMNLATGTVVVGQVVEPGLVRVGGGS